LDFFNAKTRPFERKCISSMYFRMHLKLKIILLKINKWKNRAIAESGYSMTIMCFLYLQRIKDDAQVNTVFCRANPDSGDQLGSKRINLC
jgi:hypothetical protein